MRPLLALTLFLAAGLAVAQPAPPPTAARAGDSITVLPGQFADVKVDVPAGASVVWRFYPPPIQRATELPPGRAIFAGERNKVYVVTAVVIDFAKKSVTDVEFEVRFADVLPPFPPLPPIPPKPDPEPKPAPVSGPLFVVVVEETSARTPELARVLNDAAFWGGLKAKDVSWRLYDKDSADVSRLGYLPHATKAGLPAVLLMDRAGKVLDAKRLAGTADVDAMLKGVGR